MSVDYRAMYGYGYHITPEMSSELDEDKFEEFIEHPLTHVLNSWGADPGYFFGIDVRSADEDENIALIPIDEYEHNDFMEMLNTFHYFFPEGEHIPHHYIIQQVY